MSYRLLVLDIDGTLRPHGADAAPHSAVQAIRAVQRAGVGVVIATGRGRASVPPRLLGGIRPDYWLCAAGAQVLDARGAVLADRRMTPEQMYALVDFCEDHELPLRFIFTDAGYAYVGYEAFLPWYKASRTGVTLKDGEDQDRHLQDMPFTAFGWLTRADARRFQQKYGHLGLRFLFDSDTACDILPPGVDKGTALTDLLDRLGIPAADCVAVGDGDNDAGMLQAAGLGVCVQGGSAAALAAAGRTCPPPEQDGLAVLCRDLWPEAFAPAAEGAPAHG